jgi:anti-sigma regulatory factor (Ser/Thr protein kinase)
MVTAAVDCASHVGRMLSLNEKARSDLKMSVRAAFLNAVDHFTEPVQEDERIHLEFTLQEDTLVVSIRERGIPFDLSEAERHTPGSLGGLRNPSLGMLLMHEGMDTVELFVHGRQGKETRMTKKLSPRSSARRASGPQGS